LGFVEAQSCSRRIGRKRIGRKRIGRKRIGRKRISGTCLQLFFRQRVYPARLHDFQGTLLALAAGEENDRSRQSLGAHFQQQVRAGTIRQIGIEAYVK